MFFDPLYILIMVATLVVSGGAQLYIRSTYGRWSQVANAAGLSGAQVAEYLRDHARFGDRPGDQAITSIQLSPAALSDHFDPRDRSLSLSPDVADRPSVASMAIAAHEVGHAQQLAEGKLADAAPKPVGPGRDGGPAAGLPADHRRAHPQHDRPAHHRRRVVRIAVLFAVLTLPVEIQASQKALAMLELTGIVTSAQDRAGTRSMLTAAALTYLAGAVSAVLTLLYYVTLARRSN